MEKEYTIVFALGQSDKQVFNQMVKVTMADGDITEFPIVSLRCTRTQLYDVIDKFFDSLSKPLYTR